MPAAAYAHLAAGAFSHPGRERQNNEDRVLAEPALGIFAVIDGVGGESGGEVAADIAYEVLKSRLSRRTTDLALLVREAIALANKQIYDRAQSDPALRGMACVLTVAVFDGGEVTVGHVGDSRLYLLRQGELRKVTRDHSPVGEREDAGELSEAEAMAHPRRNEIFRDVGSAPHRPEDKDFIDVYQVRFEPDSALLLCSDGLSDLVPAREILDTVAQHAGNPDAAARALIDRANAHGGKDNVSVVMVEGPRFAASQHGAPAAAAGPARGAAHARGSGSGGAGKWLFLLLLLALLGFAAWRYGPAFLQRYSKPVTPAPPGGTEAPAAGPVAGSGDGGTATLAEAIAQADPGETVEVAPGEYRETVVLREGVRLVSTTPGGAVLRPAPGALAVTAQGIRGAGITGFRILGGVKLVDSTVELDGVEITGAAGAGIEIGGTDRSAVRYSYVHRNAGGGIVITGEAAPRLLHNLIADNGTPARPLSGLTLRGTGRPLLAGNRFEGNGLPQVALPDPERAAEIFRWNGFGNLLRNQAVGTLTPPVPQVPPR